MLLTFILKFNLEKIKFDTINSFIYIKLDKMVFICIFFEYNKNIKILHLNKIPYKL